MVSEGLRVSVVRGLAVLLTAVGLLLGGGALAHRSAAADAAFAVGDAVSVFDGPVNLRVGPGLDAPIVAVVPEGSVFAVKDGPIDRDGYTWVNVFDYGYGAGWMAAEFLTSEAGGFPSEGQGDGGITVGDAVRVSDGPLNVRAAPGLDAEILDVASDGALFAVRGGPVAADGYLWVEVFNYEHGRGWMAAEFLAVDPAGFPNEEGA